MIRVEWDVRHDHTRRMQMQTCTIETNVLIRPVRITYVQRTGRVIEIFDLGINRVLPTESEFGHEAKALVATNRAKTA